MSSTDANSLDGVSLDTAASRRKRARPACLDGVIPRAPHPRTVACDACRVSKTRCDATRPTCAKCMKRGKACVYPDNDPASMFEEWGNRILKAIEDQGELISSLSTQRENSLNPSQQSPGVSHGDGDDAEAHPGKDVLSTPITASDNILKWSVFPATPPAVTFTATSLSAKPNPFAHETLEPSRERILELRDIYNEKCEPFTPFIDNAQLDEFISDILVNGFGESASSCFVLAIFAIAAIWGHYPQDERRVAPNVENGSTHTVAVPEHRLRESSIYFSMAQARAAYALQDDSLLGVLCFCLMGSWYWYNLEPVQGWKMFRNASMLWQTYHMKQELGNVERSVEEQSLSQRLFWTCLRAECEMRYELPDLPLCTLQDSLFSSQLPSFPPAMSTPRPDAEGGQDAASQVPTAYYHFLADVALRRLLNRARHAATALSPDLDWQSASAVADRLTDLEDQLAQWLACLPPCLHFSVPPDEDPPPPDSEPELVKLMRERYLEVRELLCRAFLYMCLHVDARRLADVQRRRYGERASLGLRLNVYRIRTERPFYRHCGSWIACRVRFNQALCLLAAARGREMGLGGARYVDVPAAWRECVGDVQERLDTWADQGGGVEQLAATLRRLSAGSDGL